MAEGTWEKQDGENRFFVNGEEAGFIYHPRPSGNYYAFVYPPGCDEPKEVADLTSEVAAKKAVEGYWADKPAPTG